MVKKEIRGLKGNKDVEVEEARGERMELEVRGYSKLIFKIVLRKKWRGRVTRSSRLEQLKYRKSMP